MAIENGRRHTHADKRRRSQKTEGKWLDSRLLLRLAKEGCIDMSMSALVRLYVTLQIEYHRTNGRSYREGLPSIARTLGIPGEAGQELIEKAVSRSKVIRRSGGPMDRTRTWTLVPSEGLRAKHEGIMKGDANDTEDDSSGGSPTGRPRANPTGNSAANPTDDLVHIPNYDSDSLSEGSDKVSRPIRQIVPASPTKCPGERTPEERTEERKGGGLAEPGSFGPPGFNNGNKEQKGAEVRTRTATHDPSKDTSEDPLHALPNGLPNGHSSDPSQAPPQTAEDRILSSLPEGHRCIMGLVWRIAREAGFRRYPLGDIDVRVAEALSALLPKDKPTMEAVARKWLASGAIVSRRSAAPSAFLDWLREQGHGKGRPAGSTVASAVVVVPEVTPPTPPIEMHDYIGDAFRSRLGTLDLNTEDGAGRADLYRAVRSPISFFGVVLTVHYLASRIGDRGSGDANGVVDEAAKLVESYMAWRIVDHRGGEVVALRDIKSVFAVTARWEPATTHHGLMLPDWRERFKAMIDRAGPFVPYAIGTQDMKAVKLFVDGLTAKKL